MEKIISTESHKIMMTRSRGRPTKPIPVHPERVISRAVQAGFSIAVELQRNTSNKTTVKHYESSRGIWAANRQAYQLTQDYSYILKTEPHVMDNNHKILFENSAKYGFSEVSRQKNSDGTVGPINQRLNACGAALREFAHCDFPFPDPIDYGTQKYKIGPNTMEFRVAGYDRSSFGPKVMLAHPDLPSMDFGDAVRSHNEYIAAFCATHDVPVQETTRYSNLFLLLVRPYLEYIYSEYKTGKPGFQKGVYNALRKVKELIRKAGYHPTLYEDRRVSKDQEFRSPQIKLEFFDDQIKDAEAFYGSEHPLVSELKRLRSGGVERTYALEEPEESCLTKKDVEYIREKAAKRVMVTGSIFHRRITALFPSPWRINDVIFQGDRYARNSDYIIVSELPVPLKNGVVKVDLVLFERTISEDGKSVFWEPRFVLEIKTRKAQRWWIEPVFKESEVRTVQRVVGEFPMDDLPLDDDMWDTIVNSTPRPSTQRQLNIYAQALADAFQQSTKRELGKILTGTIIIDSTSEIDSVRRTLEQLIVHVFEKMRGRRRRIKRTAFTPKGYDQIALVVHEQEPPTRKDTDVTKDLWGPIYSPFKGRRDLKREFILYLSGRSSTSGGQSAAWHARNHHGLQMLYDINTTSKNNTSFLWIDLADQFNEPCLAEARLRLRPRGYSEEEFVRVQPEYVREFFERIEVRGHLDDVLSFLYQDEQLPEFTFERKKDDTRRVIVITGTDTLRDATPTSHRERLRMVMDRLINCLPDDRQTTVVWFDSPVPSVDKALPYSSRALLPFYDDDSLSEVVTDIIWNLPVAPIGAVQPDRWTLPIIGDSPMHDDIRVIIHHSPSSLSTELTHVPFLKGWSKRFRNKGRGLVMQDRGLDDVVPEKSVRNRMKLLALTYIPWLVQMLPDERLKEDSKKHLKDMFVEFVDEFRQPPRRLIFRRKILGELTSPPTILDLLYLRLPDTRDAKSYATLTVGKINSHRLYRSPNKLQTQPIKVLPPSIQPEEIVVPEELVSDTVFGIKFETEGDLTQPWWLVLQDPDNEVRILVGCFTHRPAANDGFMWAETRQETLKEFSVEGILGLTQTILTGSKTDAGMETWITMPGSDQAFDSGLMEVISRGRSTVGHLRAFRQTFTGVSRTRTISGIQPTESFYNRVVDSLRRYLESVASPTSVTVDLKMIEDACQVTFIDTERGEVYQTVILEHTADLISLLRWPMVKGGPMYTDSGEHVTWSVFDDIQFEDLDFLKPYISFSAARSTPEELPKRIVQFFEQAKTICVRIEHDHSVCPIVTGDTVDHGECWRITPPPNCPGPIKRQLGKAMTGEEVNGLLAPGRLYSEKLYILQITRPTVSQMNESIVFHEDRYIRMLLRGMGLSLKPLEPGTFLRVSEQKWYVDISWDGSSYLRWSAQSLLSGLYLDGPVYVIELSHSHGAEEECERLMESITSDIPEEEIANYSELEERVLSGLKNLGYSGSSPPCHLRVLKSSSTVFSYGIYPVEGSLREPLVSFTIEAEGGYSPDALIEMMEMSLSEGDLSHFNIRNSKSFMRRLETWVSRYAPVIEDVWEESEE